MLIQGLPLVLSLLLVVPRPSASSHLVVMATFDQNGVCGDITFSQEGPSAPTIITVSLTGMECFTNRLTHVQMLDACTSCVCPSVISFTGTCISVDKFLAYNILEC